MKHSLLVILFVVWSQVTMAGFAQNSTPSKPADPAVSTLQKNDEKIVKAAKQDQLIAEALKYNPDVRVAEAKLREAEAELNRSRIRVIADLRGVLAEIEAAEASKIEGEARWKRAEKLYKNGSISSEDYGAALLTYEKLKGELIAKQIRLPYLLGDQVGTATTIKLINESVRKTWEQNVKDTAITDDEFIRRAMLDILGRTPQPQEIAKYKALPAHTRRQLLVDELIKPAAFPPEPTKTPGSVDSIWMSSKLKSDNPAMERLRKSLEMPVKLKVEQMSTTEIMTFLRAQLPGNLHVRFREPKDGRGGVKIEFSESVPMGAFLQYLEDEMHWIFILRDYGIVVVPGHEQLPPGALRVTDFWKHTRAGETTIAQ